MPAKGLEDDNRLQANVEEPEDDDFFVEERQEARPPAGRTRTPTSARRPPRRKDDDAPTGTIYLSENVSRRLDEYRRKKARRTNRDVVLEAISALHARLPEVLESSKVSTAVETELFPADERQVRYLGGGKVQAQFTPTVAQAQVLNDLGERLGFPFGKRSTWIAPVLNEFLPGRKDER